MLRIAYVIEISVRGCDVQILPIVIDKERRLGRKGRGRGKVIGRKEAGKKGGKEVVGRERGGRGGW